MRKIIKIKKRMHGEQRLLERPVELQIDNGRKKKTRELRELLNNCVDDDEAILYKRELEEKGEEVSN